MEALRSDRQRLIDEAVSRITKTFEEQIAKLMEERDAALGEKLARAELRPEVRVQLWPRQG